ncbi:MAG: transcription antitermination factor NusB [Clostridia bacterium]|nr:transcription antitermination factor NusB [Clostridia bacterium]
MKTNKKTRREERSTVMELLFSASFRRDESPDDILLIAEEDETFSAYIKDTFLGASAFIPDSDKYIEKDSKNWKIARLSPVTSAILHLSVYEMLKTDVPPKVAINEAVELSKKYDDESAAPFVNGILNRIARENGLIGDVPDPREED